VVSPAFCSLRNRRRREKLFPATTTLARETLAPIATTRLHEAFSAHTKSRYTATTPPVRLLLTKAQ